MKYYFLKSAGDNVQLQIFVAPGEDQGLTLLYYSCKIPKEHEDKVIRLGQALCELQEQIEGKFLNHLLQASLEKDWSKEDLKNKIKTLC